VIEDFKEGVATSIQTSLPERGAVKKKRSSIYYEDIA